MTLPLSVTTPSRQTGCPPIFTSWRATYERAIGITSTGRGKVPSTVDQLGVVDDADEFLGGGCDNLLAGERGASALDQRAVGGGLIGTVDVEAQGAGGIEIEFRNAGGAQAFGGSAGTRDSALEPVFYGLSALL